MTCEVCGAELAAITTDLPFKVREVGIVILKGLPVLQCASCPQYLLETRCSPASTRFCAAWTARSSWRSSATPLEPWTNHRRTTGWSGPARRRPLTCGVIQSCGYVLCL